jgi:isopropylmalate/homocitrate/citramalate synthase
MVGRRRKFYLGKFSGTKSVSHALQQKIKVLDLDIPIEIIRKISIEVKKKHETTSKEELRKSFNIIKEELKKLTTGVSDKDFFEIVNKYAQPYIPEGHPVKPKE